MYYILYVFYTYKYLHDQRWIDERRERGNISYLFYANAFYEFDLTKCRIQMDSAVQLFDTHG